MPATPIRRPTIHTEVFQLRLSPELKQRASASARRAGYDSLAAFVRDALSAHCDKVAAGRKTRSSA